MSDCAKCDEIDTQAKFTLAYLLSLVFDWYSGRELGQTIAEMLAERRSHDNA